MHIHMNLYSYVEIFGRPCLPLGVDDDHRLVTLTGNTLERPQLDISLHDGVRKLAANQTLGVENLKVARGEQNDGKNGKKTQQTSDSSSLEARVLQNERIKPTKINLGYIDQKEFRTNSVPNLAVFFMLRFSQCCLFFIVCFETGSIRQRAWPVIRKACNPVQTKSQKGRRLFWTEPPPFHLTPISLARPLAWCSSPLWQISFPLGFFPFIERIILMRGRSISNSTHGGSKPGFYHLKSNSFFARSENERPKQQMKYPAALYKIAWKPSAFQLTIREMRLSWGMLTSWRAKIQSWVAYLEIFTSQCFASNPVSRSALWRVSRNFFGGGEC